MPHILRSGEDAPDFTLPMTADKTISLKEFQEKPVILAFYPADWSPVCGNEMTFLNQILPEFKKYHAHLLGISVDGIWSHTAFSKENHLHFPLLSDFEPKGRVAKMYGAYREKEGFCERALFVIDKNRKIAWSYLSPVGEIPGADGILEALEKLTK